MSVQLDCFLTLINQKWGHFEQYPLLMKSIDVADPIQRHIYDPAKLLWRNVFVKIKLLTIFPISSVINVLQGPKYVSAEAAIHRCFWEKVFENTQQQIYRRTPMPKCDSMMMMMYIDELFLWYGWPTKGV